MRYIQDRLGECFTLGIANYSGQVVLVVCFTCSESLWTQITSDYLLS